MNDLSPLTQAGPDTTQGEIIKLACLAVGGQGGGVLGGWIEATARAEGYACQATSVAGVAQRTGSTIYYIEMAKADGKSPVFSLAPSPGDVDIVIGAELMEAGRAIMRGFVTPDRTTLIGSTHRVISIAEKTVPGDGVIKPDEVHEAAKLASHRLVMFDLEKVAIENGSVISASLLGALAGSGALPFPREAFEDAVRQGGKGLRQASEPLPPLLILRLEGQRRLLAKRLLLHLRLVGSTGRKRSFRDGELLSGVTALPESVQPMARAGLRAVVDYQNLAYGQEYLDRIAQIVAKDKAEGGWVLSSEAAKYVARAMCYDDIIRVADLKTRGTRSERVRQDIQPADGALLQVTEYLHPRAEEIAGLFPARMGERWSADPRRMARLDRWVNKGRRIRSDRLGGFLLLYVLGGLRGWRLRTWRHKEEQAHLDHWVNMILEAAESDYALAVEITRCRRLIKGYSDTHARGMSKYDRVLSALPMLEGRDDAADWLRRLREAALQDEKGETLDGALKTVASFI